MGNKVVVPEKSVRDQIREQKRNIERSVMNIQREKRRVEQEEAKMKKEIKKFAAQNQHKAAMMIAKDLVRVKGQINKMNEFCGQLKAVSLRIGSIATLNELSIAMEEAGKAITTVSGKLDSGKLAEIAKNMAREDDKLNMKSDMMQEILEGIGDGMDDPVEQQKIYEDVCKDLNIDISSLMPEASSKTTKQVNVKQEESNAESDTLDEMLKQLQK